MLDTRGADGVTTKQLFRLHRRKIFWDFPLDSVRREG
jgi:hypothetical protein